MKRMLNNKFILCLCLGILAGNVEAAAHMVKWGDLSEPEKAEADFVAKIQIDIENLEKDLTTLPESSDVEIPYDRERLRSAIERRRTEIKDKQKRITNYANGINNIRKLICDNFLNKNDDKFDRASMSYIEHRGYLGHKDLPQIQNGKKYYIGRCCTNIPRPIFSKFENGVYKFRDWSRLGRIVISAPEDKDTLAVIKDQIKEFLRGGINNIQYKETVTPKNSDYSFHSFTCQIDAVKTTFIIVSKSKDVSKLKKENIEKILVDFEGGE